MEQNFFQGIDFSADNINKVAETEADYSSSIDPTDTSIYQYDNSSNPEYFLLKKKVKAISGNIISQTFPIGSP